MTTEFYMVSTLYALDRLTFHLWQYGLWTFQAGDTKLERFLPKNQRALRKLLNFENWLMGSCQKEPKLELPA